MSNIKDSGEKTEKEEVGTQKDILLIIKIISWGFLLSMLNSLLGIDVMVSRLIYNTIGVWSGVSPFPWNLFYSVAQIPLILLDVIALFVLVAGFFMLKPRRWRRAAIFTIMVTIICPIMVVNVIFKDNLGRPRPREIAEFGGPYLYTELFIPGPSSPNSSFPSGHATVAFCAIIPYFIFRKEKPCMAKTALVSGLLFGAAVGLTRMIQGGHFLFDVIWAGCLVFVIGMGLALIIKPDKISH